MPHSEGQGSFAPWEGPVCAWPACPGLPALMHQRLSGVCPQPSSSAGLRWERSPRTHCVSNSFLHDPTPCASARCGEKAWMAATSPGTEFSDFRFFRCVPRSGVERPASPPPPVSAVRHGHTRGRPPDFPESAPFPASSCGGCLSSSELRSHNVFPWQVIKTPMARAVSLPTGRKKPGLRRRKYRPARVTAPHGVVSYGLETRRTAGPRTGV